MKESMSIVAAPAILLFLELLALLTINRSFCNGISDLGFFRSEKQDLLRFKQELKLPSNGLPRRNLKAAYEQPNLAGKIITIFLSFVNFNLLISL